MPRHRHNSNNPNYYPYPPNQGQGPYPYPPYPGQPPHSSPRQPNFLAPLIALVMLGLIAFWIVAPSSIRPRPPLAELPQNNRDAADKATSGSKAAGPHAGWVAPAEGYLFCHWNVENFYDDQDDPHNHDADEDWFAENPALVRDKVEKLAEALLLQNDGHGPDILAIVEVESKRCVELLRDALNSRLAPEWRYQGILQRDYHRDRRLAPAVLTRLSVRDDLTRLIAGRRILEAHLEAPGAPLVIFASHWTSRLRGGTEAKREAYADVLYEQFLEQARNDHAVDLLISGDFNDDPEDESVRNDLHATGDAAQVRESTDQPEPALLDLMIGLDPESFGTYFYRNQWQILDHIVAAPGLLDPRGWQIVPESLKVANSPALRFSRTRQPWRFGGPDNQNPRGYSDHFAITVRLKVQGSHADEDIIY